MSNLRGFVIRKGNGSNNSLFLSCQMGLSDGAFFMIKHTPLPNRNHPISSPVCPMGVADTLEPCLIQKQGFLSKIQSFEILLSKLSIKIFRNTCNYSIKLSSPKTLKYMIYNDLKCSTLISNPKRHLHFIAYSRFVN